MLTNSDFCEDRMPYHTPFPVADPVRGRVAKPVTHHRIGANVDPELLDEHAPLTDDDRHALANCELQPHRITDEVERHVRTRIHAVQYQLWGRSLKWRDE